MRRHDRSRSPRAPFGARLLVRLLVPARHREFVEGDLDEEFSAVLRSTGRRSVAKRRYWRLALASVLSHAAPHAHAVARVRLPVPTYTTSGADGAMPIAQTEFTAIESMTGCHVNPASRDFQSPPVAAPTQISRASRGDRGHSTRRARRADRAGDEPVEHTVDRHLGRSAQPVLRGDTGRGHRDGERVTGCVRAGVRARRERDRRSIRSTGRIASAIIATMSPVESWLGLPAVEATARVLERTRAYVELETPSGDATRLCRLASLIEAELTTVGSAVEP
ncbi:MAG: hypothetical protein ACREM1_14885, partial [Longimicrobiales bacterium]